MVVGCFYHDGHTCGNNRDPCEIVEMRLKSGKTRTACPRCSRWLIRDHGATTWAEWQARQDAEEALQDQAETVMAAAPVAPGAAWGPAPMPMQAPPPALEMPVEPVAAPHGGHPVAQNEPPVLGAGNQPELTDSLPPGLGVAPQLDHSQEIEELRQLVLHLQSELERLTTQVAALMAPNVNINSTSTVSTAGASEQSYAWVPSPTATAVPSPSSSSACLH